MSSHTPLFRLEEIGDRSGLYWLGVALSLAIAGINLYIGSVTSDLPFVLVGCSFLLGVGLFFTRFWSPVFYLLGVLHIGVLGVIWILSGMQFLTIGLINGALSLGLAAIAIHLLFEESRRSAN